MTEADGSGALAPTVTRTVAVGLLLVAGVALLGRSVDPTAWLTADGLRDAVGADEWYGPVGYVSAIVAGMFLPIPKAVVLALGGVLFGPAQGFLYAPAQPLEFWAGSAVPDLPAA